MLPYAARNGVSVPAALRGSLCFCPDWRTIYGVVAGPPSWVSQYVSPETTRRRPHGAQSAADQLDHVIPANPRSARDAAQAVGEKHLPIKSMAASMIGNSLWLVVGSEVSSWQAKLPIKMAEWTFQ
jgi:hypothetical protein